MKNFSIAVLLSIGILPASGQTTIYKPGAQGQYGTGGSYVAPATTRTYSSPSTQPSTYHAPSPSNNSSYRSSYSSPSSSGTSHSSSSGNSGHAVAPEYKTPAYTDAERIKYKTEQEKTIARIAGEDARIKQWPLFCSCPSAEIDIRAFMLKYPTPERYLDRAFAPQLDIDALNYVASHISTNALLKVSKQEALDFLDRYYWQLGHLGLLDKRSQLDKFRLKVIRHASGADSTEIAANLNVRTLVVVNHFYGYADGDGNVVIPAIYDEAYNFEEGRALVSKKGKFGYIDLMGKVLIPFEYTHHVGKGDYSEMTRNGKIVKFKAGQIIP